MVKIAKGNKVKTTSFSSFENFYKNSGWELVEGSSNKTEEVKPAKKVKEPEIIDEPTDDEWEDAMDDEEVEKPLSEMNNAELKEYAAKYGIDITGLNSNKQIREAIKAAM